MKKLILVVESDKQGLVSQNQNKLSKSNLMDKKIPYKTIIVTSDQYIFKKIGYELYLRIKKSDVKIYSENEDFIF